LQEWSTVAVKLVLSLFTGLADGQRWPALALGARSLDDQGCARYLQQRKSRSRKFPGFGAKPLADVAGAAFTLGADMRKTDGAPAASRCCLASVNVVIANKMARIAWSRPTISNHLSLLETTYVAHVSHSQRANQSRSSQHRKCTASTQVP
jgi:hypothetical protein